MTSQPFTVPVVTGASARGARSFARQDQRRVGTDEWQAHAPATDRSASIIPEPCAAHPAAEPFAVCRRRSLRGFTLVEMLVVVIVAGVLASIALPSFEAQIQRARRTDALVSMAQLQSAQERYRSNAASYGSLEAIGAPGRSPAGHYVLQTAANGTDGYEALATATGAQARDTSCRVLRLSVSGANMTYASGTDGSLANPVDINRRCWNL